MAVTHSTAMRNTLADAIPTALGTSPKLVFRLSGTVSAPGTAVATLTMSATPFAAASGGTITANDLITSNGTDGTAKTETASAGTNVAVLGPALEDGASGDRVATIINPFIKQGG